MLVVTPPEFDYLGESRRRRRRREAREGVSRRRLHIHEMEHDLDIGLSERLPGCGRCMGPPMKLPSGALLSPGVPDPGAAVRR